MRGAVTTHDRHILLREDRSTRAQNWASRRGAFTFRQEKNTRFASSGISGHSKSGRTQTKLNRHGGISFGPLRRNRRAVRVFAFTSCDSKNYDCLQTTSSESSRIHVGSTHRCPSCAKRAASEKNPCWRRSTWTRAKCGGRPLCMTVMDGVPDKKTRRCWSSVTKRHRRCSRRKSSINIAQWGFVRLVVVVRGSGVDEWPCIKLVWVFKYIHVLVHVYIGMPIKLFFLYESQREGGGGSPSKFFWNTDLKKNFENYGRPLSVPRSIKWCKQRGAFSMLSLWSSCKIICVAFEMVSSCSERMTWIGEIQ